MQNIITHQINGVSVLQRESDGFFNATAMCKASDKKLSHYKSNDTTQEFLEALSTDAGIPASRLIQAVRGGSSAQGTWVHPKVAIHLAQWLSPKFAVKVTNLVMDWFGAGSPPSNLPEQTVLLDKSGDLTQRTISSMIASAQRSGQDTHIIAYINNKDEPVISVMEGKVVMFPRSDVLEFTKYTDSLMGLHAKYTRSVIKFMESSTVVDSEVMDGVMGNMKNHYSKSMN